MHNIPMAGHLGEEQNHKPHVAEVLWVKTVSRHSWALLIMWSMPEVLKPAGPEGTLDSPTHYASAT